MRLQVLAAVQLQVISAVRLQVLPANILNFKELQSKIKNKRKEDTGKLILLQ